MLKGPIMVSDPLSQLSELPEENPHYIRAATQMGDRRDVIADQDIFAENGMKLFAKGAKISSHQFDLLTKHKLSRALDQVLATERSVDGGMLAFEAGKIIEHDSLIARIVARTGDPLAIKHQLACLVLPLPIRFRLTVMQDQRAELFEHALRNCIISFALAQQLKLSASDKTALTLAALCHDLGEMHTDPELLTSGHKITSQERRYIHVHPITSYVVVHTFPEFSLAAENAILQHHERLDGSGYPYGLRKPAISRLAQIIAIADVADAVLRRFDLQRLDVLFTLLRSRFDSPAVKALRDLLHSTGSGEHHAVVGKDTSLQLAHIADFLQSWLALHAMLEGQMKEGASADSPLGFLFERMQSIRALIVQAGLNPDDVQAMHTFGQNDPEMLAELQAMLSEMEWMLYDLANEIERRSPALDGVSQEALKDLIFHLR
ncbi:HD-GYP domain-containing protein [Iodobacter ciconiae]|uniref:HD domain-containing protein n=1 Tax=Iodobacter ciconiae TaxID=2496266 RepID=A0A3S8ZTE5_9NEIS|nr:HD domain-containing phosphohydrolase [Iodobacter ciconiae]AZN36695.1 HD domain-containing protein [Iodobacter ciconiae]